MSKPSGSCTNRYAKRGPVIMPVEPPYEVLQTLAGDPLILAASTEKWARMMYAEVRKVLAERKKK